MRLDKNGFIKSKKCQEVRFSLDIVIVLLHIAVVLQILYTVVLVPLHTNLDFNKDDKGEITFTLDYNKYVANDMTMEDAKESVDFVKGLGIKTFKSLRNRKKSSDSVKAARPSVKAKDANNYKSYIKDIEDDGESTGFSETMGEVGE